MRTKTSTAALALSVLLTCPVSQAQSSDANDSNRPIAQQQGQVPVFRVTVVARTTSAINYRHRSGATTIDFRGTPLLPQARGEAKVESKQGYIETEVEFDNLEPATKFGPEYLTYVMWAITPEGRATNLGEVLLNGTRSKLNVTTELQAFGLIVTAEPYFAVTQPSDVVVMENVLRPETVGKIEQVEAKYELLKRGTYLMESDPTAYKAPPLDPDTPLELHEARNALQLSQLAGADRYAGDTYQKASQLLQQAENLQARKGDRKPVVMTAREAAQTAEDARLIAVQRREEARVAQEREASARREANARATAQSEAARRQQAEADRMTAERARTEAEATAERAAREKAAAEATAQQAAQDKSAAEAARVAAEAAQAASQMQAEQARQAVAQSEKEKAELREKLLQQLNVILETRATANGLIMNMSDVLFDTGRYTLKPGAREKLAKVAGVLLAYPGLRIEVDGHTDSVGTEEYNQTLSENRAAATRDYLIKQGIPSGSIVAHGFGEARPVVSNDSAAGRQQNRRVELVVSGELLGGTTSSEPNPGVTPQVRR